MDHVTCTLTYIRGTKGLCRYEEEVTAGQQALLGALYLAKARLGTTPPPRLTLTIEEPHATH